MPDDRLFRRAQELAFAYLAEVDERPVALPVGPDEIRARLVGPLPEVGEDPRAVIEWLAAAADPGLVASGGPRYFGFVMGGAQPAALAADWLTSTWDQNAGLFVRSPAAAVAEEVAGEWLRQLLGLPAGVSFGFTSGGTMANFTALATARHALLARLGWDVETHGLRGAPTIHAVASDESHATVFGSFQMLGIGRDEVHRVPTDDQGRMRPDALVTTLAALDGPVILCAQAGNVNTGAFDPMRPIAMALRSHPGGGWLHLDGAIGLWAAAVPSLRHLTDGLDLADSWTTDSHKWLNVPYDSGVVFTRDPEAHRAAMSFGSHGVEHVAGGRDSYDYVPESSRRARGFVVLAALRALGREGFIDLIERCCAHARLMAERLSASPDVEILADVVLNQVLVRFSPPGGGSDEAAARAAGDDFTQDVINRVQRDGTSWLGGRVWHGRGCMRVSVTSWNTTTEDIGRSTDAILRCLDDARLAWNSSKEDGHAALHG
ncbi:MAG TPA: pyridoxal-dependent decarboxylase [Candidatus Limnocylindrales bacterium]|nr:pyridoxal-dependent decarboxylase [Candidatus Limnocylindrales bacterium]